MRSPNTKKFVLENRQGQVVRYIDWQGSLLHIVYIHDTKRIITTDNLEALKQDKIEHTLIQTVQKSEVQKKSIDIAKVGTLRCVSEIENLTPSLEHSKDDIKPLFLYTKYVGATLTGILVLFSVISYFVKPEDKEVRIVEIIERPVEAKPTLAKSQKIQKPKIVTASNKKSAPRQARTATPRKAAKVTTNSMSINQVGALGVLGSLNKSNQKGGLNLNNVTTSPGIGRGGNQGSGGMQTTLYGKGIVSAPLGSGQRADGAGGYGTKGKGGGQAGYGQITLVGSAGSYFQPVKSEALVEGGLSRNEIDAVIQRHIGEIRYCYEQGLQQNPTLSGRVSMRFFIGADGYITAANPTNSSLRSKQVENCMTNRLKSWKFPNPRGGVVVKVNYPFELRRPGNS